MILGIGNDLVDVKRVERILARHGERFIARCFTGAERDYAEQVRAAGGHVARYAKRFAAKEACVKALGTGFRRGITMKDVGVVNDADGRPSLVLTGGARERLAALTPAGRKAVLHLSLSDEYALAQAFVIIEAL